MEPLELSPALLVPQDSAVTILGELLATLPRENETLPVSAVSLYRDLLNFTRELRATLYRTDDTWRCWNATNDDVNPLTSLSQALAAYDGNPGTPQRPVLQLVIRWSMSLGRVKNSWAELAKKATELHNTCREVLSKVADMAATATTRARELQAMAAHDGTAQENMVGLVQALGREEGAEMLARYEAWVRREAMVAASEATRATMVRQRVEAALGLLERLVDACDEATALPRELSRLLWDMEEALEGRMKESSNVPEAFVYNAAMAEWLWEASAREATRHLVRTFPDAIKFLFTGGATSPSACGVAKRCQRAIEDIPRLLRPLERPEGVPRESPESLELHKLSPALLQPQVTVVATLGELLATLPRQDEEMLLLLLESAVSLHWDLEDFTRDLRITLYCTEGTWWRCNDTSDGDDRVISLSQVLAAYRITPGTHWRRVTMAASKWHSLAYELVDRWAKLAKKATQLCSTFRRLATKTSNRETTTRARELQDKAARNGTAQENMVGLGQALGREEEAEVVAGREAWDRREAMGAASWATRATMVRLRVEVALGLLERLVAACDEATAFPRELHWRLRDTETTLEGANEASPGVPEALVAQVTEAERLWEANARLAKDHLLGTVDDIFKFYIDDDPTSPSACGVAERCQRTTEDIPKHLQPPECPQSVPKVSQVTMELHKVSSPQLQVLVAVVATLGEVVATVTGPHWGKFPDSLHEDLKNFTRSLRVILNHGGVTSVGNSDVTSLRRALATTWATPGTTWADVRAAASAWRELVARLVDSWDWLVREATKLREKGVTAQQLMVAQDKKEVAWAVATYDAQVVTTTNEAGAEAVAATRRGHWAVVAQEPLQRLVAVCVEATLFYWNMEWQLRDMEAILKGTNEASPDVLQAVMVKVVKFEWLWEASSRLAKEHLLGTLEDIHNLLFSPCGGPSSRAVAERCQKAIEDIPRLLQESFT